MKTSEASVVDLVVIIAVAMAIYVTPFPHFRMLMHEQFITPTDSPAWYNPKNPATWKHHFPTKP
jgi:hypothetical protein